MGYIQGAYEILKKKYIYLLRFFFLGLSVLLLINIVDFKLVLNHLAVVPWFIVISLLAINLFRAWLVGLRWCLINPDPAAQLSAWHYYRFVILAHTFNLIMPGALGGDVVKTALTLKTVRSNRIDNVIGIAVDHLIGLFSIIILGTIAFFFINVPDRSIFNLFWGGLYGAIIVLVFILFNTRFHKLLQACFSRLGKPGAWLNMVLRVWQDSLDYFRSNKKKIVQALLLCLPIHIISFLTKFIIARNININVAFIDIALVTVMVWLVTTIPLTISGAGVRELSTVYFLSFYGVSPEAATALSVYSYMISVLLGLVGLLFIVDFSKVRLKRACRRNQ